MPRFRLSFAFALIGLLGGAYIRAAMPFDLGSQLPVTTAFWAGLLGHVVDRGYVRRGLPFISCVAVAGVMNGWLALWLFKWRPMMFAQSLEDAAAFTLAAIVLGGLTSLLFMPGLYWLVRLTQAPPARPDSVAAVFRARVLPSVTCAVITIHGAVGLLPFGLVERPFMSSTVLGAWVAAFGWWTLDVHDLLRLRNTAARWKEAVATEEPVDDLAAALDFGEGEEQRVLMAMAQHPYRERSVTQWFRGTPVAILARERRAVGWRGAWLIGALTLMLQGPVRDPGRDAASSRSARRCVHMAATIMATAGTSPKSSKW